MDFEIGIVYPLSFGTDGKLIKKNIKGMYFVKLYVI